MGEAYDLRSNIKDKPGSQGTLFQVKDKGLLNTKRRWPQGYNPERLNEVRQATQSTRFASISAENPPVEREHVNRLLAKSTAPASDLRGIRQIHNEPAPLHAATYWLRSKTLGIDLSRPGADRNLIHEIGHHADEEHARHVETLEGTTRNVVAGVAKRYADTDRAARGEVGEPNSSEQSMAANRVRSGVREAVADNYMEKHYRTGGRNSQPVAGGAYQENFAPEHLDRNYPGYSDVRPHRTLGPQFQQGTLF